MRAQHSGEAWAWRWDRDSVTELELCFVHERREWQQRAEHDGAGWSDPVVVDLQDPEDEQDAERIASAYAGG